MTRRTKIVATVGPQRTDHDSNKTNELGLFDDQGLIPHGSIMQQFIEAGVDIIRLNMSFAPYEKPYADTQRKYLEWLSEHERDIADEVAVLGDLPGPKIRLGEVDIQNQAIMKKGDDFYLGFGETRPPNPGAMVCINDQPFNQAVKSINNLPDFAAYVNELAESAQLIIGDGKVELHTEEVLADDIVRCSIISDLVEASDIPIGKGLTIRNANLDLPAFGEADQQALDFLLENGGNMLAFVAVSFVQNQRDVLAVKHYIEKHQAIEKILQQQEKSSRNHLRRVLAPGIIAKIETQTAWENIDEILDVTDGIMIARGDLGVHIQTEEVPRVQKELIHKCNTRGKVVITATQMLDSMEKRPTPTRAEANDVFNAMMDGTDAVMLSGETSIGAHPIKSIKTMAAIAESAERYYYHPKHRHHFEQVISESALLIGENACRFKEKELKARDAAKDALPEMQPFFTWMADIYRAKIKRSEMQWTTDQICKAACELSEVRKEFRDKQQASELSVTTSEAKPVIIPTTSGRTVFMISRFRPLGDIIGATHYEKVYRKLLLSFGVRPIRIGAEPRDSQQTILDSIERAIDKGLLKEGMEVVAAAGTRTLRPGTTNMIQIFAARKKVKK